MVALLVAHAAACDRTAVTPMSVGASFATTFANLISSQEEQLGKPGVDPQRFEASATCHRVGPGPAQTGSGDWVCTVSWSVPSQRRPLHDAYDVTVGPDACYTANADRTEAHVGGPTLTTHDGRTLPNLLYVFDACFDAG
jgi:hypothetical protein